MGSAIKQTSRRWKSGIIPYKIDPEVTGINSINSAIAIWERNTNVRFVRHYLEPDYVEFVPDAGAVGYSYAEIGKCGGRQVLASSQSFDTRTFVHEIGHMLGLLHEHQRSDRDQYVTINLDNVSASQRDNFKKMSDSLNSDSYDYKSIMHYHAFDFATNRNTPVIQPIDPKIQLTDLGSASTPTSEDINMVNFIYPHAGIIRRSSSQHGAGAVREISSLAIDSKLVTAVKTGDGKLKMILWNVDSLGGIQRLSPIDDANTGGGASFISIAQAGDNIVTAMRSENDNLYLIAWQLENGQLVRKGNSGNMAGTASLVNIIGLTNSLVLTACRTESGNLKLILWEVDKNGIFRRVADSGSQAGEVTEISLIKISSSNTEHIVSTVVKAEDGHALVITWAISVNNNTITRRGDSGGQIGQATNLNTTIDSFGHLIVSCKTAEDNLLLISLSVSPGGTEIKRIADTHSMAGVIRINSLVTRTYGVVSAVSTSNGYLLLIKWEINQAGQFTRLGDSASQAGMISMVDLVSFPSNPDAPLCSTVRDDSGNLLLISWDDDPRVGELQRKRKPVPAIA